MIEPIPAISTGFPALDLLIQGTSASGSSGFPEGRPTQVWAAPAAGLASFAVTAIQSAASTRGGVLVIDWEGALQHLLPDKVTYANPVTLEEGVKRIRQHFQSGTGPIFLFRPDLADFANSTYNETAVSEESQRAMGNHQGWAHYLPLLTRWLQQLKIPLVGFFQKPAERDPNSMVWKFYAHLRISLEPSPQGWVATVVKSAVSDAHGQSTHVERP